MLKEILKEIVSSKRREGIPNFVIKNFLKEYLQYPVLSFIYNNKNYKRFIFTGGSCLRICFNAPRLSEDLDFELNKNDYNKLNISIMAGLIKKYFKKNFLIDIVAKCQTNKRIYLKFPVLKDLGLAKIGESNFLYVKIEISESLFVKSKIQLTPVSYYGFNFVVRNYSLPFLMTGKLRAIFNRKWYKGDKSEIDIKGRDFYDLFWYLQKGVLPDFRNLKKFIGIANKKELKRRIKKRIEKNVTPQKLAYDLKNFFPGQDFIFDFCKNYKKIIGEFLKD